MSMTRTSPVRICCRQAGPTTPRGGCGGPTPTRRYRPRSTTDIPMGRAGQCGHVLGVDARHDRPDALRASGGAGDAGDGDRHGNRIQRRAAGPPARYRERGVDRGGPGAGPTKPATGSAPPVVRCASSPVTARRDGPKAPRTTGSLPPWPPAASPVMGHSDPRAGSGARWVGHRVVSRRAPATDRRGKRGARPDRGPGIVHGATGPARRPVGVVCVRHRPGGARRHRVAPVVRGCKQVHRGPASP